MTIRELFTTPLRWPAGVDAWDVLLVVSVAAAIWGIADIHVPAAKIVGGAIGAVVAVLGSRST